jgi:hypothetical protein
MLRSLILGVQLIRRLTVLAQKGVSGLVPNQEHTFNKPDLTEWLRTRTIPNEEL